MFLCIKELYNVQHNVRQSLVLTNTSKQGSLCTSQEAYAAYCSAISPAIFPGAEPNDRQRYTNDLGQVAITETT